MTYNGRKRFKLPQVTIVICDTLVDNITTHFHTNGGFFQGFQLRITY